MAHTPWLQVAAVAAVAAVVIATASPASDPSAQPTASTASIAVRSSLVKVDVDGSHRDSPGDLLVYAFELWNASETQRAGDAHAVCTMVRVSGTELTAHCAATARLAGGTIESSGLLKQPGSTTRLAVTGGTGRYGEADGELTLTALDELAIRLRIDLELDV
jgi:allene oxide cyclase-like protein